MHFCKRFANRRNVKVIIVLEYIKQYNLITQQIWLISSGLYRELFGLVTAI